MRQTWKILVGVFQVLFAVLGSMVAVRMALTGGSLLWRKAPVPLAMAGAAIVAAAVVAWGLNGIRTIADGRRLGHWRKLPILSGVLGCLVVAIFASDIVYTESRSRTGNARDTALGRPAGIAFTALDGRQVDLGATRDKVTLVFCWATWCGPCKAEMPEIQVLERKWSDRGFEVVAINFDEDRRSVENFVREKGLRWPQHFEGKPLQQNSFAAKYELTGIPQMWLVDKRGLVRDVEGYAKERLLDETH